MLPVPSEPQHLRIAFDVFDYPRAVVRLGGEEPLRDRAWEFLELHEHYVAVLKDAIDAGDAEAAASAARALQCGLKGLAGARPRSFALMMELQARRLDLRAARHTLFALDRSLHDLAWALRQVVSPGPWN